MTRCHKALVVSCALLLFININISICFANSLEISNVVLGDRNPSTDTIVIEFDISWNNAWRTKINHDAVWLTARLSNPSVSPTNKKLCQLTNSGLNPNGTFSGSSEDLELFVPADLNGAFLRPANYGVFSAVTSAAVQLTVDYSSCGFTDADSVHVSILGLEMVLVPEASFYAGDYNGSTAALNEGSADADPWYVGDAGPISVSNPAGDGYRYVSGGQTGEDATGVSFLIGADFPEGYAGFYAMKYELTEGQWVDFINALPSSGARANHDLTDSTHKNTDTVTGRNTISCSGTPLSCSTSRPYRPVNYLTWMDLAAFLDWASIRPMTELEYEKMTRGPVLPITTEYAWGTTDLTAAGAISGSDEDGTETITTGSANANYNNTTLTGGDAINGAGYNQGALRNGIFATSASNRILSGAGYYGVMELSGNLKERVVTIGNATGRAFVGSHGDGILSVTTGYEGNANETDWPGIDAQSDRGVTGASGSGFRGGSWVDGATLLRISDRSEAAKSDASATNAGGGRGVRDYEG